MYVARINLVKNLIKKKHSWINPIPKEQSHRGKPLHWTLVGAAIHLREAITDAIIHMTVATIGQTADAKVGTVVGCHEIRIIG